MSAYGAMVADKIALGVLGALYIGFHVLYVGLIIYLVSSQYHLVIFIILLLFSHIYYIVII
jgi:hypothetical protein